MKNIATLLLISLSALLVLGCENEKVISLCSCAEFSERDLESFKKPYDHNNVTATVRRSFDKEYFVSDKELYEHLYPLSKNACIVELKYETTESQFPYIRWAVVKGSTECPSVGSKIFGNMHLQMLDLKLFIYDATFTVYGV